MTAELTEGELAADAAQAGQNTADSDTSLLARQEADSPAETPQSSHFCGTAYGFCCCSSWPWHFCAVQGAHLCRPYRQNFVRSIAKCGAVGWRRRYPLTKRHLRNFCKRIAADGPRNRAAPAGCRTGGTVCARSMHRRNRAGDTDPVP